MRPPTAASALCIFACIAFNACMSKSPRASPDWFVATATRQPFWFSCAIAARLPGSGVHSSGDLMKWSLS